uniref:SH2 domain-containing protein n=1 Tax=Schistocephalus solidus TaxID=70667 RepID=A0A0X3QHD4_SCHSO
MSTTQELDQLLDELRMTSMNISSSGRPPTVSHPPSYGHSSRSSFNSSHLNSTTPRYPLRSASSSSNNYQRGLSTSGAATGKWSSYQREAAYSSERQFSTSEGGPFKFQRSNSYGQAASALGNSLQPSPPAPAPYRQPVSPSKRYQTTYKTTLTHLPPASPKRFGQVYLTIDPESGCASTTSVGDVHYLSTGSTNRYHTNSTSARDTSLEYREQRLLEELRSAQEQLASLRRANSVSNEPCRPPMTLPLQRRHLAEESLQQQGFLSNRQQSHYLSQHSVHQGSSTYRPQSRLELPNSGFQTASGLPKRALSTANMMNSQGWSYRNGAASEIHSPLGYPTVRSYTTTTSSTGRQMKSPGYSARRERLRMESEQQEQLTRQQQLNRSRMHIGSSSDLHQQQMQRRQHYHSMSTIQPERRAFEELETITLQPIGKGVQDLDSRMGSTTTLSQPPRAAASSMMEGLNRVDNVYPSQRPRAVKNMTNFGKQASAVDISRQNHSGSTSFLSSRRISGGALSDLGGFKERGSEQTLRASNTVIQQRDAHQTVWTRKSPVTFSGSPTLMQVQETAPAWYRLKISRQEAIAILRHQPPGSFLVRDSTTYKDAYGLAVRVAKSQNHTNQKSGFARFMKNILNDVNSDLVRHYLIETVTTPTRGVRIKGFSVEPIFASLVHLIYEHTRTPLALPCCLVLPAQPTGSSAGFSMPPPPPPVALLGLGTADSDAGTVVLAEGAVASGDTTANNGHPKALNGSTGRNPDFAHSPSQTASSSAASGFGLGGNGGLRQPSPARNITSPLSPTAGLFASELTTPGPNFFCRCLYLGFVDVEWSLGETAVERAVDSLIPETILESVTCDQLGAESPVQYTECQLQVSPQEGILLTDLNRKIFFQRHLSSPSIVFVGVDPRDKMFLHPNHAVLGFQKPRLFGVVIKKLSGEHVCHVFSEFDSNHSAFSIVSQINALLSDNK